MPSKEETDKTLRVEHIIPEGGAPCVPRFAAAPGSITVQRVRSGTAYSDCEFCLVDYPVSLTVGAGTVGDGAKQRGDRQNITSRTYNS